MSSQAEKFKIGLFVMASLTLAIGIVIWLGATRWFQESKTFVAYFSESVQGLETGGPVKFRGVPVGTVDKIRMAPDDHLIEVVMSLRRGFRVTPDLGIKMNLLGITGQKYLEINRIQASERQAPIKMDFEPPYPVITTYTSDIEFYTNALDIIVQKIKAVELEKISRNVFKLTARLDKILGDPKLDSLGADASDAIREFKKAAIRTNNEIQRLQFSRRLGKTLDNSKELLEESTRTVRSVDRMIRRTDNSLNLLTQKLDKTAANLEEFSRNLRDKPTSIIFGPPEKKKRKPR
jgi:phospholipid/cholesterol/gamma-HCH transport system substrate-binding protein